MFVCIEVGALKLFKGFTKLQELFKLQPLFFLFSLLAFFISSVPDDQSLKVYRAEANWGMMRFSDALTDLDYLCCLRPNWTEVRDGQIRHVLFCTAQTNLLRSSINNTKFKAAFSLQFTFVYVSAELNPTCSPLFGFVTCL